MVALMEPMRLNLLKNMQKKLLINFPKMIDFKFTLPQVFMIGWVVMTILRIGKSS